VGIVNEINPRVTSLVSGIVAALVPVANQLFGWHLDQGTVLTIVLGLIAIALAEVGHAHAKAQTNVAGDVIQVLKAVPELIAEIQKANGNAAGQVADKSGAGQTAK
jgi:hypothetical protein